MVSRNEILKIVWGYDVYPSTRTIDNFILNFRKHFEQDLKILFSLNPLEESVTNLLKRNNDKKIGVLLVNLGSPDNASNGAVFSYLNEFLTDGRVIDYPVIPRNLLVRGIIVPFRYKNSARTYREIWTKDGSPLIINSKKLLEK